MLGLGKNDTDVEPTAPPHPHPNDRLEAFEMAEFRRFSIDAAIKSQPTGSPDEIVAAAEKYAAFIIGDVDDAAQNEESN